jgi:hypothetical protein
MTFTDIYLYADILMSEEFEGVQRRYKFNEAEWF